MSNSEDDNSMNDDNDQYYESDLYFSDTEEVDFDLENQYYSAKSIKHENPERALEGFASVLNLEERKGDWGFKALKQMMKILFQLNREEEMLATYRKLLEYVPNAVTQNYSEKSIGSILDYVSASSKSETLCLGIYELTLDCLKQVHNERLWFKATLKLGRLFFMQQQLDKVEKILRDLRRVCQTSDGVDDVKNKGTQLLEVYALEIQVHTTRKDNKKLKDLYERSLRIKSAIPHPLIMGVIRECGGKMHLREQSYDQAYNDFFEAFKNYDESGNPRRTVCLKYLVLANMLMNSQINPFDSQETAPYRNEGDIVSLTNLLEAYQRNDIDEFERILRENEKLIMEDAFIKEHIEFLLHHVRIEALVKLVKPYTRVNLSFLAKKLNIDVASVENLLCYSILDGKLSGRIDQELKLFQQESNTCQQSKYEALSSWATNLAELQKAISPR